MKAILPSAEYWRDRADTYAQSGEWVEAYHALQNAFNHTETALAFIKDKVPGVKEEMTRIENSSKNNS